MKKILVILFFFLAIALPKASAVNDTSLLETEIILKTPTGEIFGTLTVPEKAGTFPVALIVPGSGPTDRNGNNPMMQNNAYKKFAHRLAEKNIATVRYDKRGVGESAKAMTSEADLRFEDYVKDVEGWIELLKADERFSKVVIIGHSEGSLIGMLAAKDADQFISVAGPARSADEVLKEQLSTQPEAVRDMVFPIIDSLKRGKTVEDVNPMLYSLFRPSVQPYMISWFKYNPQNELKQLSVPILIIQGTSDIQVPVNDAALLAKANPKVRLEIIEGMNHVFRIIEGDRQENLATYNKPDLPISEELVIVVSRFINSE